MNKEQAASRGDRNNGAVDNCLKRTARDAQPRPAGPTAAEKTKYYRDRIAVTNSKHGISSDDPEAFLKVSARLEALIELQHFMRAANKCIRHKDKAAFLLLDLGTQAFWKTLNTPDSSGSVGFSAHKLANNNSNIRRTKLRLDELTKVKTLKTTTTIVKGIRVVQNVEANRLQLIFPSKPSDEVMTRLQRAHNFHWYIKHKAWHRLLNRFSVEEAEAFLDWYDPAK